MGIHLMKKSTKAVLLSALVFPGVGHIFLKKYISGLVLVTTSLVAIYYLISKTVERTLEIIEKIQKGNIQLNVTAINELVPKQSNGTEAYIVNIVTGVLIICWIISIIDSYRVGCESDKKDEVY